MPISRFSAGTKIRDAGELTNAAADFDFAAVRPLQAGDAAKRGRLAATARTQKNAKISLGRLPNRCLSAR